MKSADRIKQQQAHQLSKLLAWVGSRKRLADECGVTPQAVYYWVKRGKVPKEIAVIIDKKTEGMFSKESLRPDIVVWG